MADQQDYKRAYERQKAAREKAESLLEERARELYEANQTLQKAYEALQEQKDQLVQQEKLASIGLLAAGVAHEINNPVGFVKSNLQTLEEYSKTYAEAFAAYRELTELVKSGESDKTTDQLSKLDELVSKANLNYIAKDGEACIEESLAGVKRIEEIIVNLSDFARTEGDNRAQSNINELLENTLKLVWNEIKYKCEIEKDFGELPAMWCWPGQLRQVFVNIIVNAAHAIEEKGTISLNTRSDEDNIYIEISDSGTGIDEEKIDKIFDPFFTTKEVGSGTGLGLYICHGIITKHQGTIAAANNPDGGAKFSISLPIEVRKNRS